MIMMVDEDVSNPKTLCDWVKNFRIKRIQMRRKLRGGGDLRVNAMITQALHNAEGQLRRKQQERFNRWMELQNKLQRHTTCNALDINGNNTNMENAKGLTLPSIYKKDFVDFENNNIKNKLQETDEERQERDEITNLWKYELNGLDEFMRSISKNKECISINAKTAKK